MTSHVTTHVLDAVSGRPAEGIDVALWRVSEESAERLAAARTDTDGRVRDLGPEELAPGTYRVTFATGAYFAARGVETFYPSVTIDFFVEAGRDHYHVPCLLSPFAYSTYRGS
ncbi:hydroxyisourate hydrolase [Isoptericola cucumis]|uniref:5-hydroxyisourate hydrolase n=1 Tax=Isoptericola cucumis TaxID=1776856 RepID=A0ABQ2B1X4_9MICO|nr:hydroxyisourate hydrolase [Isoptericola cucumis]GGI05884.1 5-hydroxyisourate hydrolase [Isoptericola cucumis]